MINSLTDISENYDVLYCDLWGCLHDGVQPFASAVTALQKFRNGGGYVMLMTNSPKPAGSVWAQLDEIGVPRNAYDDVTSSGDASQTAMLAGLAGMQVFHIGPERDLSFFNELPASSDINKIERVALEQAEGIVCTGLFDDGSQTPEDYRATLLYAKQKGLTLLCTNPDLQVDRGHQRIYCAGAIAALYTEMGGQSLYFGKPHPPIYELARNRIITARGADNDRILCVGDGIRTDILGGLGDGLDTLFITGGLAAGEFGDDPNNPNLDALNSFFDREKITPTYTITQLR